MSEVIFNDEVQEALYGRPGSGYSYSRPNISPKKRRLLVSLLLKLHLVKNERGADQFLFGLAIIIFFISVLIIVPFIFPSLDTLFVRTKPTLFDPKTAVPPSERIQRSSKSSTKFTPAQLKTIDAIWTISRANKK